MRYTWIYNPTLPVDDDIIGKHDAELMENARDAERIDHIKRRVITTGKSEFQEVTVHYQGQPHYFVLTIDPLQDETTQDITGIICTSMDVTKYKQLHHREKADRILAEALYDTAIALTSTLDLSEVLDRILINMDQVIPHDAADIMLVENDIAHIARSRGYAQHGLEETVSALRFSVENTPTLRNMAQTRKPIIIDDMQAYSDWLKLPHESWLRAYVGVPIEWQEEIIGFLNVVSAVPNFFNEQHLEWLKAFAAQAAVALHNAQLHEKASELAKADERHRLARELHDSVNQMLFSSSMIAEALQSVPDADNTIVMEHLQHLERLNRGALAEMRLLLQELRPENLVEMNLEMQLRRLVDAIKGREKIEVSVKIKEAPALPPDVRLAYYRIAQEALNNIIKHAKATHVDVIYQQEHHTARMTIADNGGGFDPEEITNGMGLSSMIERAENVGAKIQIESQNGSGTAITVTWSDT